MTGAEQAVGTCAAVLALRRLPGSGRRALLATVAGAVSSAHRVCHGVAIPTAGESGGGKEGGRGPPFLFEAARI